MKKTYINPNMEVIKIEVNQMLASSAIIDNTLTGNGGALGRELGVFEGFENFE